MFFSEFLSDIPKITPTPLEPRFFRPIPVLRDQKVAVISGIVNFASQENKLPETHTRCFQNFLSMRFGSFPVVFFSLNVFSETQSHASSC